MSGKLTYGHFLAEEIHRQFEMKKIHEWRRPSRASTVLALLSMTKEQRELIKEYYGLENLI